MKTYDERGTVDERKAPDGRHELVVQLYYDRADAARYDERAARIIDMAIAALTDMGADQVSMPARLEQKADPRLH